MRGREREGRERERDREILRERVCVRERENEIRDFRHNIYVYSLQSN